MGRIERMFERTRAAGRIALMPYLPVGYPSVETTLALAPALVAAGADMFELGIPYSDPLADGATVQHATHVALQNGVTPALCLEVAQKIRALVDVPIVPMVYTNPIVRYGPDAFARDAAAAGVDGFLVPDLPPEESDELAEACARYGLDLVYFVAPTSTDERMALVARESRGFVYCVALAGVTGARSRLSDALPEYLERVRRSIALPLVVGFGISQPEHVAVVAHYADGAIVGSALIDRLDALAPADQVAGAAAYVATLAAATARPPRP
jgi:tryptophan synthase alpha chain